MEANLGASGQSTTAISARCSRAQMDEGDPFSWGNYVRPCALPRFREVWIALIAPGTYVPEDRAILYPPSGCPCVSRYEIERARMLSSAILIREIR